MSDDDGGVCLGAAGGQEAVDRCHLRQDQDIHPLPLHTLPARAEEVRSHRIRIKTEEKAKVVVAMFGGKELIQFLAALTIFHQGDWKKAMNLLYSSYRPDSVDSILHNLLVQFILFFKSSW